MNPPIRNDDHRKGCGMELKKGSGCYGFRSCSAYSGEEKKKKYPLSPSGMTGVQTLLPIMLNFVNKNKLTIQDLVRLISVNP